MKNFKKVLALSIVALILLKNNAYATTSSSGEFNVMKIGLLALAVLLIAVVLYLSYKNDSPSEIKPKKQKEVRVSKKDSLKEELAEKDNTYEVEEDEAYEDDSIEPVSVGRDEDEISLFESVNNPDTVKEEKEEPVYEEEEEEDVVGFVTKTNIDQEKKSNSSRFERYTPTKEDDDTVNDFFSMDDDDDNNIKTNIDILNNVDEEIEENVTTEDSEEEYDYNYDYEEEEDKNTGSSESGTMVFDSSELNSKIDILNNSDDEEETEENAAEDSEEDYNYDYDFDFDKEEKEEVIEEKKEEKEDLFAGVKEEPTEFVGFTTIKPKEKTRGGNSRFERPNYSKIEEDILNGTVKNEEEEEGDSANDFLAQMAKNLGGEEVKVSPVKKTAAKKTTTTAKKTTAAKKTTTSKTKTTKK